MRFKNLVAAIREREREATTYAINEFEGVTPEMLQAVAKVAWAESGHPDAQPYVLPPIPVCRECSRPERPVVATHGELCVYCHHALSGAKRGKLFELRESSTAHAMLYSNRFDADIAARARLAAFDKRNAPRVTAESRMLALPHPWSNADE